MLATVLSKFDHQFGMTSCLWLDSSNRQPTAGGDHCRPVVSRRRLQRVFAISHETVQFAVTKDSRIRSAVVFISLSVCAQPSTAIAHKVRAHDLHSHRSNNAPTNAINCLCWSVLRNEIGMRHFYEEILAICESFTSFLFSYFVLFRPIAWCCPFIGLSSSI